MTIHLLKSFLNSIEPLSENEWQAIESVLYFQEYKQGTVVHPQGQPCKTIKFISSGIWRCFIIDIEGKEHTFSFHFNGVQSHLKHLMMTDYMSLIEKGVAELLFEVITDSKVIEIPYEIVNQNCENCITWNILNRKLAEQAYCITQKRVISLLTLTAAQRYQELKTELQELEPMIPDYMLASYLGITPQSFSRLKRQIKL